MMTMEETRDYIDGVTRDNYEDPRGMLYDLYACTRIPYDELDEEKKNMLRREITQCILQGNIDTRLDEESNEKVWNLASKSIPSDMIILDTEEDLNKFRNFWKKPNSVYKGTPSDIFFADTIPMKDCCINLNYNWMTVDDLDGLTDEEIKYLDDNCKDILVRIVIFDYYKNATEQGKMDMIIGMVIMDMKKKVSKKKKNPRIGLPFFISDDNEYILFQIIAYDNLKRDKVSPENIHIIQRTMTKYLDCWYGIQLALLNPITEEVFEKKRANPISVRKEKIGLGKNRHVVYTRKYKISAEDIDHAYEERRKNNMSCPLWYVIGHWRQYQNGNRIFIKGYWKGPERERFADIENKSVIDNINSFTRERKVIVPDNIED